ncbi:MAG: hypothetical protein Q9228_003099 [Teloschistes exilis]
MSARLESRAEQVEVGENGAADGIMSVGGVPQPRQGSAEDDGGGAGGDPPPDMVADLDGLHRAMAATARADPMDGAEMLADKALVLTDAGNLERAAINPILPPLCDGELLHGRRAIRGERDTGQIG